MINELNNNLNNILGSRKLCSYCGQQIKDGEQIVKGVMFGKWFHNSRDNPCFSKWKRDKQGRKLSTQEKRQLVAAGLLPDYVIDQDNNLIPDMSKVKF